MAEAFVEDFRDRAMMGDAVLVECQEYARDHFGDDADPLYHALATALSDYVMSVLDRRSTRTRSISSRRCGQLSAQPAELHPVWFGFVLVLHRWIKREGLRLAVYALTEGGERGVCFFTTHDEMHIHIIELEE